MDNTNKLIEKWNKNIEALVREDKIAKEKGVLVGRYIKEQYADGYALYKITKETKYKVTIEVVKNVGDDWEIPYWGEKSIISKKYALDNILRRDGLEELFGGKK